MALIDLAWGSLQVSWQECLCSRSASNNSRSKSHSRVYPTLLPDNLNKPVRRTALLLSQSGRITCMHIEHPGKLLDQLSGRRVSTKMDRLDVFKTRLFCTGEADNFFVLCTLRSFAID